MGGNGEALVDTGSAIPLVCINKLRKGSTHHVGAQLPISGIVRTFQSGQEFTGQDTTQIEKSGCSGTLDMALISTGEESSDQLQSTGMHSRF